MALRKKIEKRKFTDPRAKQLLVKLSKAKAPFWTAVGKHLATPRRNRVVVNVSQLANHVEKGDQVVVPGKLLGAGSIDTKVTVAAYHFSESAVEKIKKAGGEALLIEEMLEKHPKGKNLKMVV